MKKIGILMIAGVLVMSTSCQSYLEDVNVNPNDATDASLENMMTSAQVTFLGYNEGSDARMTGMWSQQFSGSDRQYAGIGAYQVNTGDFDFFEPYIGVLQTADLAIEKADEANNTVARGTMKLLKGATYGYIATEFGDAPFTEANQYLEFPNPNYDPQMTVLNGALALLDEAISDLGGAGGNPSMIFVSSSGSPLSAAQLRAVAHSYKARIYLHMGDLANAAISAGSGIALGGDMIGTHGTAKGGDRNMWYDFFIDERGGYLTCWDAYLPSIMDVDNPMYIANPKTDEAARFGYYYDTAAWTYDASEAEQLYEPNTSATGIWAQTASYPMITFAETQLIIAEAAIAANDATTALNALNAVRAELASKFPTGTYDAFVAADFANNQELLDEIILEKYKSLNGQTEAWNDMTRLGNPFGLTPIQGSEFPQRFLYPQTEVNANSNVPNPLPSLFAPTPVNQ